MISVTINDVLPVILYILGSILLVILIILGVKLINTMNKINIVVDDINRKSKSLDGLFSIIDVTTDKLALLSDRMVDGITFIIRKLFSRKKRKENDSDEEEE